MTAGANDPKALLEDARQQIEAAADSEAVKAVERAFTGKKGSVSALMSTIPTLPPEERKGFGQSVNELKRAIQDLVNARLDGLEAVSLASDRKASGFDATLPPAPQTRGSLHPITQVTRQLEDLFESMGYEVLDGPEVELDHYNFEALNIPADHPARDSQDTFYCDAEGHLVMRTHTSPVQVRAMERLKPPFRVVAPGKCFRQETTDATHDHTFHQMEGLVVGKDISVAHLIGAMQTLLEGIFDRKLDVRMRPGFFPFVEPGFELDARCPFCNGGCSVCKQTTWIELLPCGLVHPNVLRAGGLDPHEWSGFAFGLGLSRLVMLRESIDDIRHMLSGNLRFLEQF